MKKFKSILNQVHANDDILRKQATCLNIVFNVKVRGNENYGL